MIFCFLARPRFDFLSPLESSPRQLHRAARDPLSNSSWYWSLHTTPQVYESYSTCPNKGRSLLARLSVCLSVWMPALSVCLPASLSVCIIMYKNLSFPCSYRGVFTTLRTLPAVVDLSDHFTSSFSITQARRVNNLSTESTFHQRVLVWIDLVTHQTSHTSR